MAAKTNPRLPFFRFFPQFCSLFLAPVLLNKVIK